MRHSCSLSWISQRQEFAYDGLKYYASVEAGTCVVAGYEEGAVNGHLVIPSEAVYNGHALAVTIIDAGAFSSCTSLTSVDLRVLS